MGSRLWRPRVLCGAGRVRGTRPVLTASSRSAEAGRLPARPAAARTTRGPPRQGVVRPGPQPCARRARRVPVL